VIALRVDESDGMSAAPDAWLLVYQWNAVALQLGKGRFQILDLVRDVVQTLASTGNELADCRVRPRPREQLQVRFAEWKHGFFNTLILDALA
jgi:hypothetical protein